MRRSAACTRRGRVEGGDSTHRPTSLFALRPRTRSILLSRLTQLTSRLTMQLRALIVPAKNLDLSSMNWLSSR